MTAYIKRKSITSPLAAFLVDGSRVSISKNELFAFDSLRCYLLSRFL